MRMQNWAKALMSLLGPLVVCSTTYAQQPPAYGPPPGGYPDPYLAQAPMNPGVFQPQFGSNGAQGMPPSALPYPAISPHLGPNVLQSQTFQQDGSWVNRIINNDRDWYFTTEYLHTDFEGPGGNRIGSRTAYTDRISHDFPIPDNWQIGGVPTVPEVAILPRGPGAFPWVLQQSDTDGWPGFVTTGAPQAIYPIRSTDILDDVISSNGVRLRGGYFDGDGTGMQLEFWWAFGAHDAVQYGSDNIDGIPITQELITGVSDPQYGEWPNEELAGDFGQWGGFLMNAKIGALPLEDSSGIYDGFFPPGNGITGSTQKYDILFRVDTNLNVGGGNLNFYLGELYRRPHVSIKSYTGIKYMFVDERFGFRGIDSGMNYAVDELTGNPEDGEFIGPFYPLFESILNATVTSHLAGPEFGLRGDLGKGGAFAVWWQGSLGLLANHETARVQGNNIGNAYIFHSNFGDPSTIGDESGAGLGNPAYDMFANDTTFDSKEQHTHVSPTLNLGVNAEIGILDAIPGIRRISLFDDAKLNVGYNMQFVGMMARAADSIRWRGFPDFPSAQIDYETWGMHQLSIGLHFER
ncbi:MAG: hypothetical protein JNG89_07665 [Planctomycetaceae bacterium]|nr:hypothetical protein [Planctomycetaceae bacterium]